MAAFSRTNWYRKDRDIVPGKPAKKGAPLKGLLIISTHFNTDKSQNLFQRRNVMEIRNSQYIISLLPDCLSHDMKTRERFMYTYTTIPTEHG